MRVLWSRQWLKGGNEEQALFDTNLGEPTGSFLPASGDVLSPVPVVVPAVTSEDAPARRVATANVLHLINGEHYSGAERVQDLLAMALPEFGFEVGFACLKQGLFRQMRRSTSAPLHAAAMKMNNAR